MSGFDEKVLLFCIALSMVAAVLVGYSSGHRHGLEEARCVSDEQAASLREVADRQVQTLLLLSEVQARQTYTGRACTVEPWMHGALGHNVQELSAELDYATRMCWNWPGFDTAPPDR